MSRVLSSLLVVLCACGQSATTDIGDTDVAADTDPYAGLAAPKAPVAYSGTCPDITTGVISAFEAGERTDRSFRVTLPAEPDGAGVLFLWHGNGDNAANFERSANASGLAASLDAIVIVPSSGGSSLGLDWAVPPRNPSDDAALFDSVLSCLDSQYGVDLRRVYSAGFSAGALWTSWLTMNRSETLAATVILSGGSDGSAFGVGAVNSYSAPARDIPVLMTEGGRGDEVIVNFQAMTAAMSGKLRTDGSTVVVCSHNQGHTPPAGYEGWAWDFLDAHFFGIDPSPYADGSDPSGALPTGCNWE